MMSKEHFEYLFSCHISNRYENTTTFCSKTTSLVSLQADFHVCVIQNWEFERTCWDSSELKQFVCKLITYFGISKEALLISMDEVITFKY